MIQLQRLEGFYWVARTGGYARAARAFPYPITQPGVHQQVRRLEADLGVRLFERVGKDQVRPTAAGQALYAYVAPFLEGLPGLEEGLRRGTHGGPLRIHAASLHLRHLLPPWLRRLQRRRPDIEIRLTELRRADLGLLRSGETDLLVDYLAEVPEDIEARVVGQTHSFVVLPSDHPRAGALKRLQDLGGETFIAYNPDQGVRELQLRALAQAGVQPARIHGADSAESILAFVAAGLGVSVVPWLSPTGPRVAGVTAHRLALPGATFPVHAARRKGGPPHPLVEAALELAPR